MNDPQKQELVVRFLASTHERLLRYVFVLLSDWEGAQEVVQNTHVVVWRKAGEFSSDTEEAFLRWVKKIAYFEVKKFLKQRQQHSALYDSELLEMIRDEMDAVDAELELQREALATCIDKLPSRDQELLRLKYWHTQSVSKLSTRLGRTIDSLYKSLQRIRRSLLTCMERESRRLGQI